MVKSLIRGVRGRYRRGIKERDYISHLQNMIVNGITLEMVKFNEFTSELRTKIVA